MSVELVLARPTAGLRADRHPGLSQRVRLREVIPGEQSRFGLFGLFGDKVDPAGEFADYYLRVGVGFADGRKATNLERRGDFEHSPNAQQPELKHSA